MLIKLTRILAQIQIYEYTRAHTQLDCDAALKSSIAPEKNLVPAKESPVHVPPPYIPFSRLLPRLLPTATFSFFPPLLLITSSKHTCCQIHSACFDKPFARRCTSYKHLEALWSPGSSS